MRMTHGSVRRARRTAPLLAALLALVTAASACAQPGSGGGAAAAGASGRALPPPDSVLGRAARSREKGPADARVTVVEISDFQCPYCRQFYEQTYHRFDSAYVKTGKVHMVYVNLPLPMHAQAFSAAKAALCAGAQGKF